MNKMKLLLHICCGPCATFPVKIIKEENIEFEGYFYNPNIHPIEEHQRRLENVEKFSESENIKMYYDSEFMQEIWENFKGEVIDRCTMCYKLRLDKTALFAANNGFNAFSTTLLVSPYQNHELIIALAQKAAIKYSVDFYYRDFRVGFREGQAKAKELLLYRQKYCGCIKSLY